MVATAVVFRNAVSGVEFGWVRMFELFRRVKERVRALGRRVQHAVVRGSLYLLYFLGIGSAHAWLRLFRRRLLPTFGETDLWRPADARDFDEQDSQRQS